MKGKIVLIPFPFTNLTATKLRPALVLFEGERDVVVVFISFKVPHKLGPTDIIVDETHPDFKLTGLKVASVIRLDKVATISKELLACMKLWLRGILNICLEKRRSGCWK